jgi:hypothetical protein
MLELDRVMDLNNLAKVLVSRKIMYDDTEISRNVVLVSTSMIVQLKRPSI